MSKQVTVKPLWVLEFKQIMLSRLGFFNFLFILALAESKAEFKLNKRSTAPEPLQILISSKLLFGVEQNIPRADRLRMKQLNIYASVSIFSGTSLLSESPSPE